MVQLLDLLLEKFLLDVVEILKDTVVLSQKLVQSINVVSILLFLESNVDDGWRDLSSNSV